MKKLITKLALIFPLALSSFISVSASGINVTSTQVVETIIVDGKIYPLVNLPAADVNASGQISEVKFDKNQINMLVTNSSKMIKVVKHNGHYMPGVVLSEVNVVASRNSSGKHLSLRNIVSTIYSFVYSYVAHFGVIH